MNECSTKETREKLMELAKRRETLANKIQVIKGKFVVLTNYSFNISVGSQIHFPANCLMGKRFSRGTLVQKPRTGRGAFLFGARDQ